MKTARLLLSAALVIGLGTTLSAQKISKHDFSSGETWNSTGEICVVCHTPHGSVKATSDNTLLWNHTLSSATYTMYNSTFSSTIDGTVDAAPSGRSKLCLGCHDGTVDLGDFKNGTANGTKIGGGDKVGYGTGPIDLTGTHPISITYSPGTGAGQDPNLKPVTTAYSTLKPTINDALEGGKVQCGTCHDVHEADVPATAGKLLRIANAGSALCLTCHDM